MIHDKLFIAILIKHRSNSTMSPVKRFLALVVLSFSSAVLASDYSVIKNPTSGLVLEPATDGTVRVQNYTGSNSQLWLLKGHKSGDVSIINKSTRKFLDISVTINLTKSPVIVSEKTDSLCQKWHVNSGHTIANACGDYVLDIPGYNPGQQVETFPRRETPNQIFELVSTDYFIIKNPASGLVLEGSKCDKSVRVQNYDGSGAQIWSLEPDKAGTFYIINEGLRKVLDVGIKANLTKSPVLVDDKNRSLCQRWLINSNHTIANACGDYVLDIVGYQYEPGQRVETFPRRETDNQIFKLEFPVLEPQIPSQIPSVGTCRNDK